VVESALQNAHNYLVLEHEGVGHIDGARDAFQQIKTLVTEIYSTIEPTNPIPEEKLLLLEQFRLQLFEHSDRSLVEIRNKISQSFDFAYNRRHYPLIFNSVVTIIFVLLIFLIGMGMTKHMTRAIRSMKFLTREVAAGHMDVQIP